MAKEKTPPAESADEVFGEGGVKKEFEAMRPGGRINVFLFPLFFEDYESES